MKPRADGIGRRAYLRGVGTAVIAGTVAGCLGGDDSTVLEEPENHDLLVDADPPYPIHGEDLPDVSVPDPIAGRTVSTGEFRGDRHVLATFLFTRCPGICPALTSNLRHVQAAAIDDGYADEVALLAFTFDPEYDTPEVLESYAGDHGVDLDAGNWHFLRPETDADAESVIKEDLGIYYQPLSPEEREEMDMHENMAFDHLSAIILANADGVVERTYTGDGLPNPGSLVADVETLRERW